MMLRAISRYRLARRRISSGSMVELVVIPKEIISPATLDDAKGLGRRLNRSRSAVFRQHQNGQRKPDAGSWDPQVYRERAEQWRAQADKMPPEKTGMLVSRYQMVT